jgi:hypothetical protein
MVNEATTQITVAPVNALALPEELQFRAEFAAINRFQQIVHATMIKDQDYGVIPGTQKPTLLKPGAEKIAKLLHLADEYEIVDRQEDWAKPFFRYLIRCKLTHIETGCMVSSGLGECNSMEAKYRWRESKRKCPACGAEAIIKGKAEYGGGWICFKKQGGCGAKYEDGDTAIEDQKQGRVENEDIYSQVNTILKMAKKRALVDAALSAGRLSNVFTQDIEDMAQANREPARTVVNDPAPEDDSRLFDESAPVQTQAAPVVTEAKRTDKTKPAGRIAGTYPTQPASAEGVTEKDITTIFQLKQAAFKFFKLQPQDVLKELGVKADGDLTDKPWDCWLKIKAAKVGPTT